MKTKLQPNWGCVSPSRWSNSILVPICIGISMLRYGTNVMPCPTYRGFLKDSGMPSCHWYQSRRVTLENKKKLVAVAREIRPHFWPKRQQEKICQRYKNFSNFSIEGKYWWSHSRVPDFHLTFVKKLPLKSTLFNFQLYSTFSWVNPTWLHLGSSTHTLSQS